MKYSFCVLLIIMPLLTLGQYYQHSAGVRLGNTSGVTYRTFMNDHQALQFLMSGRSSGIQVTTTYHFYKALKLGKYDSFFVYYGPGGHIGVEQHTRQGYVINEPNPPYAISEQQSQFVIGLNAIAGIEYRMIPIPLVIGFDIKPYLNYIGMRELNFRFWDAALTIKYAF